MSEQKVISVITSCETYQQMAVATRYAQLFLGKCRPIPLTMRSFRKYTWLESKIMAAIRFQYKIINKIQGEE